MKNIYLAELLALTLSLNIPLLIDARPLNSTENLIWGQNIKKYSADKSIVSVKSYGFVDLEGAKPAAIIVEYDKNIEASSLNINKYEVTNYVISEEKQNGFDKTIEIDYDGINGNEGQITRIYVNNKPELSKQQNLKSGKYVIIELNTSYMMSGQNLPYMTSMMAGIKQLSDVFASDGSIIKASSKEISNYSVKYQEFNRNGKKSFKKVIETDKNKIVLPEFSKENGWNINYIGDGGFKAYNCYSEYTGKYEDFEMPYSIFVPSQELLEANKGNIALVIHMEHAGGNDTDPMAAVTSSKAAVKLSNKDFQKKHPAIVVVPQIEETRRSTNDMDASSEANTAIWELIDEILDKYREYIDENRIYGSGQSMGGMTILNMASQRDNFFGGIAIIGAQWSNNYNKEFQHNGAPTRTPEIDPISFNGFGLDKENFKNWYYMVSDDNILVHTCLDDLMSTSEWKEFAEYYEAAGVKIPHEEWDPYISLDEQYKIDVKLTSNDNTLPGSGIYWGTFTRGTHMSTWKYGYQIDYPYEWLFAQSRQSEISRGKVEKLKNNWLGRDENGKIKSGSGTANFNSAQYTPNGSSDIFYENWTPVSAMNTMINKLLEKAEEISCEDFSKSMTKIRNYYKLLSREEKLQIRNYTLLLQTEVHKK